MLYTIGYESKSINGFITKLKNNNIKKLIDVRELPISRKKGYSKSQFSKLLEYNDIDYIHIKELGSPKKLRKKLREDLDFNYFFKEYRRYLKTQHGVVYDLYETILKETCCLMCYEDLPTKCHRIEICNEIKKIDGNGLEIKHL